MLGMLARVVTLNSTKWATTLFFLLYNLIMHLQHLCSSLFYVIKLTNAYMHLFHCFSSKQILLSVVGKQSGNEMDRKNLFKLPHFHLSSRRLPTHSNLVINVQALGALLGKQSKVGNSLRTYILFLHNLHLTMLFQTKCFSYPPVSINAKTRAFKVTRKKLTFEQPATKCTGEFANKIVSMCVMM